MLRLNLPLYFFLPPHPLRQSHQGLTEKVLTSPNSRSPSLQYRVFAHDPTHKHHIANRTARYGYAISRFGLTCPLHVSRRGLSGKLPSSENTSEFDRTNIGNRNECRKAATSHNGRFAASGALPRGINILIFLHAGSR